MGCTFRRLFTKCKYGCLYRAQSDFHLKILLFSSSCLLSDLFALYTTWPAFFDSLPEAPFSFSLLNLLLYPSECNTLSTVFWLKVFVLHSFSFAVMSCKVSRLLLLTERFKAFLSLFVELLFLPLRIKVSTVQVLRYLLRTLVIVVLGLFNILDSSALFCTDSDRVTIIYWFVAVDSSAPFWLMRAENKFSWAKQKKNMTLFSDLTLNLMLNDWKSEVSKHKQLLFLFFRELCSFFHALGRMFVCFYFC